MTESRECAPAIGQETETADADKAAGQDVKQETSQELFRGEGHRPVLITVCVILPAEGNLVALEGQEAVVGDGNAMGVAGEIAEHMMGAAKGWLGVDDPVLTEQGAQEGAERPLVGEWLKSFGESELARYNIAPTQPVPIIRQHPKKPRRELSLVRWGLIPSWAQDASGSAQMINARSETAATKLAFRDALACKRK